MTSPDDDAPVDSLPFESLEAIRAELWQVAFHDLPLTRDLREMLDGGLLEAIEEALLIRQRKRMAAAPQTFELNRVTVGEVVARAIRTIRDNAGLTQQDFAKKMVKAGFVTWKRITVAEVESAKRKLSIEEMIGVAALFDVPVAYLLTALLGEEQLELNETQMLTKAQAQRLVADAPIDEGWDGVRMSPMSVAAASLVLDDDDDWLPSSDEALWAATLEGENGERVLLPPGWEW